MRLRKLLRRTKTSMVANLHLGEEEFYEDSDKEDEHMTEVRRQDSWSSPG